jgi:tetrapyrrole methylase family protein / MazG family protein
MPRSTITIAGLGPGGRGYRTLETVEAIDKARRIVLRTAIHPDIDDLVADPRVVACDDLYENAESFEHVYDQVARRVVDVAEDGDLLYLTPGHPRYGEHVTERIERLAEQSGHQVRVLAAVSAYDVIAVALRRDLMSDEPQSVDATTLAASLEAEPFAAGMIDLSPYRPVLVTQVFSREMAVATKLGLSRLFPDDHPVTVVRGAGTAEQVSETMPLHRLDRATVDHLTSVWTDSLPGDAASRAFAGLLRVAARLRAPDGCPWDREQSARSLLPSLLEEAYEVVEALQSDDVDHAAEELGDLLLHVVMQSQIAEEEELFRIEDVVESITTKLIRRHPHVFGEGAAESADDVLSIWQKVKAEERASGKTKPKPSHPLDRYPAPMPIARRLHDLLPKNGAIDDGVAPDQLGDRLFELTRQAIAQGLDPERILLEAARRHIPES